MQAEGLDHRSRGQRPRSASHGSRALKGQAISGARGYRVGMFVRPSQGARENRGSGSEGEARGYDGDRLSDGGNVAPATDGRRQEKRQWTAALSRDCGTSRSSAHLHRLRHPHAARQQVGHQAGFLTLEPANFVCSEVTTAISAVERCQGAERSPSVRQVVVWQPAVPSSPPTLKCLLGKTAFLDTGGTWFFLPKGELTPHSEEVRNDFTPRA